MRTDIQRQMTSWDHNKGDRIDPVAQALRRLHLRVELCPCKYGGRDMNNCQQCLNDLEMIEQAWIATEVHHVEATESTGL